MTSGGRARRRDPLVPPQHGAWAFLVLPLVLALAATGWFPLVVPLAVAWVAAYPVSWAVTGWLTAPRPERFVRAVLLWTPLVLVAGVPVLVLRPWLVWVVPCYVALFAVNLAYARRRAERRLGNDLVLVAECAAMVPVAVAVAVAEGGRGWRPPLSAMADPVVGLLTLVCALALVGSVLHVKSLIRERRDPRYAAVSRVFAVACVPVVVAAALLADRPAVAALGFVVLAVRAVVVGGPGWRPAQLGLVELGGFVAVAVGCAVAV